MPGKNITPVGGREKTTAPPPKGRERKTITPPTGGGANKEDDPQINLRAKHKGNHASRMVIKDDVERDRKALAMPIRCEHAYCLGE